MHTSGNGYNDYSFIEFFFFIKEKSNKIILYYQSYYIAIKETHPFDMPT